MNINYNRCSITLLKDDQLTISTYVDAQNGADGLSEVIIVISAASGDEGCKGLLTYYKVDEDNPDGTEYFISAKGLIKSPML